MAFNFLNTVKSVLPANLHFIAESLDANTKQDKRKRLARGGKALYADDQRARGVKNPVDNVGELGRNLAVGGARAFPRAVATAVPTVQQLGSDIKSAVTGKAQTKVKPVQTKNPVLRFLAGSEEIQSFQQRNAGNEKVVGESRFRSTATPLAFLGTTLGVGLDATPTGGVRKNITQQLVKAGTTEQVKKLLKDAPDDVAQAIASTKDPNVIQRIIDKRIPPPQVITRSPLESDELLSEVNRGKLRTKTEVVPIESLKRGADTADNYDPERITKYADDIDKQKTIDPLVVDKDGFVQDGKHRLAAMQERGVKEVPVVRQATALVNTPRVGNDLVPPPPKPIVQQDNDPVSTLIQFARGQKAAPGVSPQKGAYSQRKAQQELYSAARGQKLAQAKKAGEGMTGSDRYFAQLKQLEGELPKVDYKGLAQVVGKEQAEKLYAPLTDVIHKMPDDAFTIKGKVYEPRSARLNTERALRKFVFGEGGTPTFTDIKMIENAFGKDLAEEIAGSVPLLDKVRNVLAQSVGVPRILLTGFLDLSSGFRQLAVSGARHPVLWTKANKKSVQYMADEGAFIKDMQKITKMDSYDSAKRYKLRLPAANGGHEEVFEAMDIASKVPFVKRTARAYDGSITSYRMDLWDKHMTAFGGPDAAENILGPKGMFQLAEAINTATGSGGKAGGLIEKHIGTLSTALFSPRLWASRLQMLNPQYYARLKGPARKEALESAAAFSLVAGTVLASLEAMGGEIETDARSSDFLKVKFGDTRYDVLGGFQQNIVFAWRELSGEKKSSQTGKVTKLSGDEKPYGGSDRLSVLTDLVANKANPVFNTAGNLIKGEDRSGEKTNPINEIAQLFIPLNFQSSYEAAKSTGNLKDAAKAIPSYFGTGVQTYGLKDLKVSDGQQKYLDTIVDPQQKEASERFFQTVKTGPDRDNFSKRIKEKLQAGDVSAAESLAREYNNAYKKTFSDWKKQYGQYGNDEELVKAYNSRKITSRSFDRWISDIKKGSNNL